MMDVTKKTLVWWRDVPIDVENGLIEYLSKHWCERIYIISANGFEQSRLQCGWKKAEQSRVVFITGPDEIREKAGLIDGLIHAEDVIHLFSGIRGAHQIFLNQIRKESPSKYHCALIMESPSLFGTTLKKQVKKTCYPLVYGFYQKKYGKMVRAVYAMGQQARQIYISYGWGKDVVYPFMYLPKETCAKQKKAEPTNKVKIVYVGRFEFATKGLSVLMDALKLLETKKDWQLDLIGGYGAQAKEIIEWCAETENVCFGGRWPADQVVQRMSEYDFCVAPSLYDGWNMTPYQAIKAGIGCIVSDNAGSQELIASSKAGTVVQAGNAEQLAKAIQVAIEQTDLRQTWKKNAQAFQPRVSEEAVGQYFVDILNSAMGTKTSAAKCPWQDV